MISQMWYNFITAYRDFFGTGTVLVLFLVVLGVLFIIGIKTKSQVKIIPYILSIVGTIGVGLAKLCYIPIEKEEKKSSKIFARIFIVALCIFAVVISGKRVVPNVFYYKSDNMFGISDELKNAMDYVLADATDNVGVVAMPGFGEYFTSYSHRFHLMYEDPHGENLSELPDDVREAYVELTKKDPDMRIVAKAAKKMNCSYVVLREQKYWTDIPLTEVGYDFVDNVDGWEIYKVNTEVSEK